MKRVAKINGTIAAYVWDYSGRMDFLRIFWDAVREINPDAIKHDEGVRFPICNPVKLKQTFENAGLTDVRTAHLDIDTIFENFDDYWRPFLGAQGPAPTYVGSLSEIEKEELMNAIKKKLAIHTDGNIKLLARAIAVAGRNNL